MTNKIDIKFWNSRCATPEASDLLALKDAFSSDTGIDNNIKDTLAELIIAGRIRVADEPLQVKLNKAIGIFNEQFAVEEFFYTESLQVFCTWRYAYQMYVHAIPIGYAKRAIQRIYKRLGIELDDEEIMKVYDSDNVYSAFFELLAETMKDNRYIVTENKDSWLSFAFGAYFNMWHIFGPMGFNGYSPYVICADIGILSPPASSWKYAAFTEEELYCIDELRIRARGRRWPTWQQNRFMGKLGKI